MEFRIEQLSGRFHKNQRLYFNDIQMIENKLIKL
jgi:hypothetical protein